MSPETPAKVNRAIGLGNRLLKVCRDHLRRHSAAASIDTDPLFALSYVTAEFLAAASNDEADIDEGLKLQIEIVRARAIEALPGVIARRKKRMN